MAFTRFFGLLAVVLVFGLDAHATSGTSSRFDGVYSGVMEPNPAMSAASCGRTGIQAVTVRQGIMQPDNRQSLGFSGFITDEGFIRGNVQLLAGPAIPFEGRVIDTNFLASAIDSSAGCVWMIRLERQ